MPTSSINTVKSSIVTETIQEESSEPLEDQIHVPSSANGGADSTNVARSPTVVVSEGDTPNDCEWAGGEEERNDIYAHDVEMRTDGNEHVWHGPDEVDLASREITFTTTENSS